MKSVTIAGWPRMALYGLILAAAMLFSGNRAEAALQCYGCHGTPNDNRPLDTHGAPFRNVSTGGFQGNHRDHMGSGATQNTCAKCHSGSSAYISSHRDGKIKLSSRINGSPALTTYTSGTFSPHTSAWSQRSTPVLGSCNNVNCHFEKTTPAWGGSTLTQTTGNCTVCHGAAPSDGHHPGHPVNGKDKHGDYLGTGVNTCSYCHADHTADPNKFSHATSAGKRSLIVKFSRYSYPSAAYTGNVSYPAYLPSQNPARNGVCSNYCHSDGAGKAPKVALTWSDIRSSQCYSCHGGRIDDNTPAACTAIGGVWKNVTSADGSGQLVGVCGPYINMTANGHKRLVGPRWVRKYACSNCHSDTITALENMTTHKIADGVMDRSKHVNGVKNVNIPSKWSMAGEGKFFAYSSNTKTCYNVYCHSDGTKDSHSEARPYSWKQGQTECNSCHGHPDNTCQSCHDGAKKFVVNNISTVLSPTSGWNLGEEWRAAMPMYQNEGQGKARANSHPKHVSQNFTCDKCHNDTVKSGSCVSCHTDFSSTNRMTEVAHINPDKHVNGKKDVAFSVLSSAHVLATYNNDKTCTGTSATGCHGGTADPMWGGSINANSVVCIGCHGAANDQDMPFRGYTQARFNLNQWADTGHGRPAASGPYSKSSNRPANFVTNACMYCHDTTMGKADHPVKGYSDSKNPYRLRAHPQFEKRFDKECVYCHMQGTNAECLSCHNAIETLAPQLANITSSHLPTVRWSNRTTSVVRPDHRSYDRTVAGATCLTDQGATKCHSGDAWTHNTGPDTIGTWTPEKKNDVKNQYVQMGVCLQCHDDDSNNKCAGCHGSKDAGGNYILDGNGKIVVPGKYGLGFKVDAIFIKPSSARATSAHFGRMHYNGFLNSGGWQKMQSAVKSPVFGTYSTYQGTWKGGKFCWNCHDPHGDTNIYMIHDEVTTRTDASYGLPLDRRKVVFLNRDNGTDYITYTDNKYTGICNVCHTNAKHHRQGSSDSHNTGRICTTCHEHKFSDSHAGTNPCGSCHQNRPVPRHSAFGLPRDCTKCHAGTILNRMDIMRQFGAKSHHVQGVPASNQHCYQCHWESTRIGLIDNQYHTGFNYKNYSTVTGAEVDLVVWGAGIRPTWYNTTTAIRFSAGKVSTGTLDDQRKESAKVTNHCLSCHSDQNNDTIPFQDCKVPRQYAWDGQSIAARYTQQATTAWGKYGTNGKGAVIKAFSAHGNATANQGGWDDAAGIDGTIPNTRGGAYNIQCYDCHSSHGSNVIGTTTSYVTFNGTYNGGNLKETQAGKGGYNMTYKASKNTTPGVVNPYNAGAGQCFDCHMTQTANQGATPAPWGYTSTFGATKPIKGYRDGYKFGDRTDPPTFAADTFKLTANPMKKNKTTMVGGHLKAETMLNYSTGATNKINGLCTPCHDPHGISPTMGVNQQYAVPLLKGTWMTSPYKEDQPPPFPVDRGTGTGPLPTATGGSWGRFGYERGHVNNSPDIALKEPVSRHYLDRNTFGAGSFVKEDDQTFAGLCLRCHVQEKLIFKNITSPAWKSQDRIHRTVKGWGKNSEHAFTCSKCHQPHNSALPRLMQTNCLDYEHRGNLPSGGRPWTADKQYGSVHSYADEHRGYPEANLMGRYNEASTSCHATARKNTGTNWSSPTPTMQFWNNKTRW